MQKKIINSVQLNLIFGIKEFHMDYKIDQCTIFKLIWKIWKIENEQKKYQTIFTRKIKWERLKKTSNVNVCSFVFISFKSRWFAHLDWYVNHLELVNTYMILIQQPVPCVQLLPYDFSGNRTKGLHHCVLYHHQNML